jgi:hypothetical protein
MEWVAVTAVIAGSIGLVLAGLQGAIAGAVAPQIWRLLRRRAEPDPPATLILLLLLVQLRSGLSVLAALISVSDAVPQYKSLRTVARVARVSGLMPALPYADDDLRPVLAQLARAQRSGASLSGSVRRMLEERLASDRARRIARARTLPVRLMIPVTLLMLPGLILLLYAPSLLAMFEDLTGVLS